MPELNPIVLNDGTADVNFAVVGNKNNVGHLISRSAQPGVYHQLTFGLTGTESNGHTMTAKLGVPSVYIVPGSNEQVVGVDFVEARFKLDKLGSTTSRKAARMLLANWLLSPSAASLIDDKEGVF